MSIYSNWTDSPAPVTSRAAYGLFFTLEAFEVPCALRHTLTHAHTKKNGTSKRLTWKGRLVKMLTTISADKRHRYVSWTQEENRWLESWASGQSAHRERGFSHASVRTSSEVPENGTISPVEPRIQCTAPHMHGRVYIMNEYLCGAAGSPAAQSRSISHGSISISEKVRHSLQGHGVTGWK